MESRRPDPKAFEQKDPSLWDLPAEEAIREKVMTEEEIPAFARGILPARYEGDLADVLIRHGKIQNLAANMQDKLQLSQIICEKLTPSIYTMIHIIEKQDNSGVHVRKQGKLIPDLIYVIEQYEARLIQINKRTKGVVNLSMYVRRSTARDFRIDSSKLKDRFSKREEEESSKRQHVE